MRKAMGLLRLNPCKIPGYFFCRSHESIRNRWRIVLVIYAKTTTEARRHSVRANVTCRIAYGTANGKQSLRFCPCKHEVFVSIDFNFPRRVAVPPWLQLLYFRNLLVDPVRRSFTIRLKIVDNVVSDDQLCSHFQRNYVHRIFLGLYKFRK